MSPRLIGVRHSRRPPRTGPTTGVFRSSYAYPVYGVVQASAVRALREFLRRYARLAGRLEPR